MAPVIRKKTTITAASKKIYLDLFVMFTIEKCSLSIVFFPSKMLHINCSEEVKICRYVWVWQWMCIRKCLFFLPPLLFDIFKCTTFLLIWYHNRPKVVSYNISFVSKTHLIKVFRFFKFRTWTSVSFLLELSSNTPHLSIVPFSFLKYLLSKTSKSWQYRQHKLHVEFQADFNRP